MLIHSYFAGMVFFIMAWVLGTGFVEVGIAIGIFAALIVEPILETLEKGNRARDIRTIFRFKLASGIVIAVAICYLMTVLRHLVSVYFFNFYFEPISFGLVYGIMYTVISKLLSKVKSIIRGA